MMAKQKLNIGDLVQIDIGERNLAFGRVLGQSQIAFYGISTRVGEPIDVEKVIGAPIVFVVAVMDSAVKSGRWQIVSHRPLEPALIESRDYFIRDRFTEKYSIYRSSDGAIRSASPEECRTLERAAVWDAEHVEDRLRDHFANRPSRW
jgi:hypothetical protein